MSTSQELARRNDLRVGTSIVKPSTRMIAGPSATVKMEPRAMQVLLALYDAKGAVLNRDDLLEQCWDGVVVGDDAVHRTIGEIRKALRQAGADFKIETIPRVGYRLDSSDWIDVKAQIAEGLGVHLVRRRNLVLGGAAAAIAAVGAGAILNDRRDQAQVDNLLARGRRLWLSDVPGRREAAESLYRRATEIDPRRADAWGWLAEIQGDPNRAREFAHRALQIDSKEPNARMVLAFQRRDLDSWVQWEDSLLEIFSDAPRNPAVLDQLTLFYQGMGRCQLSREMNERAVRVEPFNPGPMHRRAMKHWIFGDLEAADKVADQLLRLYPRSFGVWNTRMVIFAFTGRAKAGLALLDDRTIRPPEVQPSVIEFFRVALNAINSRSPRDIAQAIAVSTEMARSAPGHAANAIMTFSYLNLLDEAYEVAEGLFEGRGDIIQKSRGLGKRRDYSGAGWGRSQFLFIPATAPFRADPRFTGFCERVGLFNYWRSRGVWPDPFVQGSLRLS